MIGNLIKKTAEYAGKTIGELAHQSGEIVDAVMAVPDALKKGYDEELFSSDQGDTATSAIPKEGSDEGTQTPSAS